MKRICALPAVAVALMLALVAALAVSLSAGVPKASAYYLANGCDSFDRVSTALSTAAPPTASTYYTPDGLNPELDLSRDPSKWFATTSAAAGSPQRQHRHPTGGAVTLPPGLLQQPEVVPGDVRGRLAVACYNHDVCYGSQKGRLYCDVWF